MQSGGEGPTPWGGRFPTRHPFAPGALPCRSSRLRAADLERSAVFTSARLSGRSPSWVGRPVESPSGRAPRATQRTPGNWGRIPTAWGISPSKGIAHQTKETRFRGLRVWSGSERRRGFAVVAGEGCRRVSSDRWGGAQSCGRSARRGFRRSRPCWARTRGALELRLVSAMEVVARLVVGGEGNHSPRVAIEPTGSSVRRRSDPPVGCKPAETSGRFSSPSRCRCPA